MSLDTAKREHFAQLRQLVQTSWQAIDKPRDRDAAARKSNTVVWNTVDSYVDTLTCSSEELVLVVYCGVVINLELRHSIRPYEYMDFSRRVGELWQKFCASAWENSSRADLEIYDPPQFCDIRDKVVDEINADQSEENRVRIASLASLIPQINLKEDMTYKTGGDLKVVDFKSGFGSNEKGNTHRLLHVANAYKFLDPESQCFLLVRQNDNNNYLKVLRESLLWNVHTGGDSYRFMREETGIDMPSVVEACSDLRQDLPNDVVADLQNKVAGFDRYALWNC